MPSAKTIQRSLFAKRKQRNEPNRDDKRDTTAFGKKPGPHAIASGDGQYGVGAATAVGRFAGPATAPRGSHLNAGMPRPHAPAE